MAPLSEDTTCCARCGERDPPASSSQECRSEGVQKSRSQHGAGWIQVLIEARYLMVPRSLHSHRSIHRRQQEWGKVWVAD
ncbi:hypothetical protein J4Q44_G00326800 [Coregonus suidteri]|uniref:Uncharacterized protein n=1 Tax=Coregonus suidteri TaxID=861788 RepID=A0AAN8QH83_9TELE